MVAYHLKAIYYTKKPLSTTNKPYPTGNISLFAQISASITIGNKLLHLNSFFMIKFYFNQFLAL